MLKYLVRISLLCLLIYALESCTKEEPEDPITEEPPEEEELKYPGKEMRGVWMATVWGLDWPQNKYNAEEQKQYYLQYLDRFKELNINTVFVQVKGMGDAFYDSPYEPWSVALTGTRGKNPGYDVLQFMIEAAHERGIEFHAWMNPFRIATRADAGASYPDLHPSVDPAWVLTHEKIQIYNPALPEVRGRLADIVEDLISQYDVEGIHFDDYFYPDPATAGKMESDQEDYEKYGADFSSIEDFRRANVDQTIRQVYDRIVEVRPEVVFSVSPASSPDYSFETLYADVRKWCKEGWLDVVIPQLYQEIGNPYNDFQARLSWWSQYNYEAAVMVGHALYKFGDGTSPTPFQSSAELEKQFQLTRRNKKVVGNLMYSAQYLLQNKVGVTDKLAELYRNPGVPPFLGRSILPDPPDPSEVKISGSTLSWGAPPDVRSVVYYFPDLEEEGVVYTITRDQEVRLDEKGYYSVSILDEENKESDPSQAKEFR